YLMRLISPMQFLPEQFLHVVILVVLLLRVLTSAMQSWTFLRNRYKSTAPPIVSLSLSWRIFSLSLALSIWTSKLNVAIFFR
ncbi:hypothetical protein KI387_020003, partial [Taxus chinensis]